MRFSLATVVLAFAALGAAQLENLPPCARTCATSALPADCNFGVKCICSRTSFINSISCCVAKACSTDDQQKTIATAGQLCKAAGVTLPTQANCEDDTSGASSSASGATTATSAASAKASGAASSVGSVGTSVASSASMEGSSVASSATAAAGTSSPSASPSGGAVQNLGSKMGAVGAAVAAFALL